MVTVSFIRPASRPKALSLLLDHVLSGRDTVLIAEGDDGPILLDDAAPHLAGQRHRVLRAAAAGPGGLDLSGLMAQVAGQPGLGVQDDAVLERGFRALTTPDETCAGIVLLVSGAQGIHRKALRYLQFACEAGASLRLVLAGEPGLLNVLDWDEAAFLRTRLASRPVIAVEAPDPSAAVLARDGQGAASRLRVGGPAPLPAQAAPASTRTRPLRIGVVPGLAVAFGMAASVTLGMEVSRHGWPALSALVPADRAGADVASRPAAGAAPPRPALPSPAQPLAGPAAAVAPDGTAAAGPSAPQPVIPDAPARPAPQDAGPAASRDRGATLPSAASVAGFPSDPAAAGPARQQPVAPAVPSVPAPPQAGAAAVAGIPHQAAPPAVAAPPAPDGAGVELPVPPRPRRRTASRQEEAPAREVPRSLEGQEASRRDMAATPHSPARTASLHGRASEDRDSLPLPPPLSRRPSRAATRAAPPDPGLFEPGPPEPGPPELEPARQPYIGTFGTDANGVRIFRLGQ